MTQDAWCPHKKGEFGHRDGHAGRKKPSEVEAKMGNGSTSRGTLKMPASPQEPREGPQKELAVPAPRSRTSGLQTVGESISVA